MKKKCTFRSGRVDFIVPLCHIYKITKGNSSSIICNIFASRNYTNSPNLGAANMSGVLSSVRMLFMTSVTAIGLLLLSIAREANIDTPPLFEVAILHSVPLQMNISSST